MKIEAYRASSKALSIAAALAVLASPAHATDGYFTHGIGAKAKGMGGTAIAYPQDSLSIAANPAAATEVGHRLDIGADVFIPHRSASITGNGFGPDASYSGNGANPFVIPEAAYVRPLSDTLAVGIAAYGNGGMNTEYKTNPFGRFGATGPAGVNLVQLFVTPTIAAKIAKGHSIGISVIGMVQGFEAKGLAPFAAASSDPANFSKRGIDLSFGGGVRIGWLGHLTNRFSVGAFYQTKIWASKFDKYAGLFADQGSFDVPASWGGGIAYRLTDRLDFAADIKRIEYSGVAAVGTPLAPLFAGIPFGAAGGPGFGWRDITAYKFGLAYKASPTLVLRTGYGRSGQPVPTSQTFLNILAPGVVRDHFTVGTTWTSAGGLEVTGHMLYAPKSTVHGAGSIPPGNPPGFGGGEADISLSELSMGVSFGFKF